MSFKIFWFHVFFIFINSAFCLNPSNDCYVLNYSTDLKVVKGKLIQEKSITIQINKPNADWISDIEMGYNKNDDFDILEAVILDQNGQLERKIRKSEIITRSDFSNESFYQDNLVKEFKMKWHEYPYQIRYAYRITSSQFLYIANWIPALYIDVPVRNAKLTIQLPKDYEVLTNYTDSLNLQLNESEAYKTYFWESAYIDQVKKESFSPPLKERFPRVMMVPKDFSFQEAGSFESWKSFGDWQYSIIKDLDELTGSEKLVVDKLIEGVEDQKEIIKVLYKYLQENTRYINITIDDGGLVPYPASYVCQNKYGDCKALTIYMKALLKHAEIDSYYTLIYADSNPRKVTTDFPSQQFNHVILCVPVKNDTIWLENTSKYSPLNYLGTHTQNRFGLLIDENRSHLVRTPTMKMEEVMEESTYQFILNEKGTGTLNVIKKVHGEEFETYKYIDIYLNERDKEQVMNRSLPVKVASQVKMQIDHKNADEACIEIDVSYQVAEQLRKLGSSTIIQLFPIFSFDLESKEMRKTPVRIDFPINKSDSVIYQIPYIESMDVRLPEGIAIESKYGSYMEHYFVKDGSIISERSFQLLSGEYDILEYPDFYDFMNLIKTTQAKSNIVINPK